MKMFISYIKSLYLNFNIKNFLFKFNYKPFNSFYLFLTFYIIFIINKYGKIK